MTTHDPLTPPGAARRRLPPERCPICVYLRTDARTVKVVEQVMRALGVEPSDCGRHGEKETPW